MSTITARMQFSLSLGDTHVTVWSPDEGGYTYKIKTTRGALLFQISYLEVCEKNGYTITFHKEGWVAPDEEGGE